MEQQVVDIVLHLLLIEYDKQIKENKERPDIAVIRSFFIISFSKLICNIGVSCYYYNLLSKRPINYNLEYQSYQNDQVFRIGFGLIFYLNRR